MDDGQDFEILDFEATLLLKSELAIGLALKVKLVR